MSEISVYIDRIVLTDLWVTPERAEHIRAMVGTELGRLLERRGLPEGLTGGHIPSLDVQSVQPAESRSDSSLASSLARNVAQALQGLR